MMTQKRQTTLKYTLLTALRRTGAPAAQIPVIRHQLSWEHLSVVSAVSMTGALYWSAQNRPCQSGDVIGFLQQRPDAVQGNLLVIWEGPTHPPQPRGSGVAVRRAMPRS